VQRLDVVRVEAERAGARVDFFLVQFLLSARSQGQGGAPPTTTHLLPVHGAQVAPERLLGVADVVVDRNALRPRLPVEVDLVRLLIRDLDEAVLLEFWWRQVLGDGGETVERTEVAVACSLELGRLGGEGLVPVRLELERLVEECLKLAIGVVGSVLGLWRSPSGISARQ
jgi:hypothetical protein